MNEEAKVSTEELKVRGEALLAKIRELIHEGNIRRIIIKDADGNRLLEVPLTVGVVGALVAPVAAAIGAVAALAASYRIEVQRVEPQESDPA